MKGTIVLAAVTFAVAAPAHGQEHGGHGAAGAPSMCMMHAAGMHDAQGGMQHGARGGMQQGMQHGAAGQQAQPMSHGLDHYITQPGRLLHHREELGLTADQVSRIEALQASAGSECERHMTLARESHTAANEALNGPTPDLQGFETRLREAAEHMVQGHTAAVGRGIEALNVLTPAQREKLKTASHGKH